MITQSETYTFANETLIQHMFPHGIQKKKLYKTEVNSYSKKKKCKTNFKHLQKLKSKVLKLQLHSVNFEEPFLKSK